MRMPALAQQLAGSNELLANLVAMWLSGARYVDKIQEGANPADLPIEELSKFELVINLKIAKALANHLQSAAIARRRGDRMELLFAAVHESGYGPSPTLL
jgi:hypothetical protein